MKIEEFSSSEIEYVLKSFSSYIKLVVSHAAIDFARKLKSKKVNIILLSDVVERDRSLSIFDSDFFNLAENNIPFSNDKYNEAFMQLSEKEQKVLLFYRDNLSLSDISKIMNITENNVRVTKFKAINKFKMNLKEIEENGDK